MTKLTPHPSTLSLDDLVRASREAFEQVASASSTRLSPAPERVTPADAAASPPSPVSSRAGNGDIAGMLTRRFGGWSARLLEESWRPDRLHVRCLLQVGERSQTGEATVARGGDGNDDVLRAAAAAALRQAMRDLDPAAADVEADHRPQSAAPRRAGPVPAERVNVALHHLRKEAASVLARGAGGALRGLDEEAVSITDAVGRLVSGSNGTGLAVLLRERRLDIGVDDMALIADPLACDGALEGPGQVMLVRAVGDRDGVIGHVAVQAPLGGLGGAGTGGACIATRSAHAEGLRVPPLRLVEGGVENGAVRAMLRANAHDPALAGQDLDLLIAACDAAAEGLQRLARRFGGDALRGAGAVLIERAADALRRRIEAVLPEEPQSFEDVIDEDGQGGGPHRLKLSVWREGDTAFFDFTGTAPAAAAAVNFRLGGEWFRRQVGAILLGSASMRFAASGGFDDLVRVRIPASSLLRPPEGAALGDGRQTIARLLDVLSGALALGGSLPVPAAPYGADASLVFASAEGVTLRDPLFGGLGGGPDGDGADGRSQWPSSDRMPAEVLEGSHPVRIESCRILSDSGGAGRYRGGNGVEKTYRFTADGQVALRGNRRLSQPYGAAGGQPGSRASASLLRAGGAREDLPVAADPVAVSAGDRLVLVTPGGGGWGDPLERDHRAVQRDARNGRIAAANAREVYGVVLSEDLEDVDLRATENLRDSMRRSRRPLSLFAFGDSPGGLSAARAGVRRE